MPLHVVIADDHEIVRQGFRAMLEQAGIVVVAEAADGRSAVSLVRAHHPDVAILDLSMPQLNGIEAAREILRIDPAARVILLTMLAEEHCVSAALRAGIRGYVLKTQPFAHLLRAIRKVADGALFVRG